MAEWRMLCMARSIRRLQLMWAAAVGQAKIDATLRLLGLFESRQTLQLKVVVDFKTNTLQAHAKAALAIVPSSSRVSAILRNVLCMDAEIASLVFERKREFIADGMCEVAGLPRAYSLVELASRWPVFHASIEAVIASIGRNFDEARAKAEPLMALGAAMEHVSDPKALRHLELLEQCSELERGAFIRECIKEWKGLRQWSKELAFSSEHEVFCIGILRVEASPIRLKLVPKIEMVRPDRTPCRTLSSLQRCARSRATERAGFDGHTAHHRRSQRESLGEDAFACRRVRLQGSVYRMLQSTVNAHAGADAPRHHLCSVRPTARASCMVQTSRRSQGPRRREGD
jgi:hypothetical protein